MTNRSKNASTACRAVSIGIIYIYFLKDNIYKYIHIYREITMIYLHAMWEKRFFGLFCILMV